MKDVFFLGDKKTGTKYKAVVREVVRQFDHSDYQTIEVTFKEAVLNLFGIEFYKKVKVCIKSVRKVESVIELVFDEFKIYLKNVDKVRQEKQEMIDQMKKPL